VGLAQGISSNRSKPPRSSSSSATAGRVRGKRLQAGDPRRGAAQERFNLKINDHFEGTRDYIVTHYKTNTRGDTDYWARPTPTTNHLSDALARAPTRCGLSGTQPSPADVGKQAHRPRLSDFSRGTASCRGMGPSSRRATSCGRPSRTSGAYDMDEIDNLLHAKRCQLPRAIRGPREDPAERCPRRPCRSISGDASMKSAPLPRCSARPNPCASREVPGGARLPGPRRRVKLAVHACGGQLSPTRSFIEGKLPGKRPDLPVSRRAWSARAS